MTRQKSKYINEFLLVTYLWGFTILKPILVSFNSVSRFILLIFTFLILMLSFILILRTNKMNLKAYIIIIIIFIVFVFDFIFRRNSITPSYFIDFLIYGIVPIHLASQVKFYDKVVRYFYYYSIAAFFLLILDPFFDYIYLGDYMGYGFLFALPSYLGLFSGRKLIKVRVTFILELILLGMILVFANRSVILSIILFWFLFHFFYSKNFKVIFGFILLSIFLITFANQILDNLIISLSEIGIFSYSLRTLQVFLNDFEISQLFSGRLELWKLAYDLFSLNIFFGVGTGYFQSLYLSYSHNLILDILLQYGIFGFIIFTLFFTRSVKKIGLFSKTEQLFALVIFSLFFPKLLFTIYFYKDMAFWVFLTFSFMNIKGHFFNRRYFPLNRQFELSL